MLAIPGDISKRIKELRIKRRLTQDQLSMMSDIHVTAISHYESGRRVPSIINLVAICQALEVTVNDLIYIKGRSLDETR